MSSVGSLWSADIKPDILSPRQILAAQAEALTELTKGILVGELSESKRDENEILFALDMFAPAIKYRHRVLTARHSRTLLYPVRLDADVFKPKGFSDLAGLQGLSDLVGGKKPASQADSDEQLVKLVEKVLKSPSVVSMAQSLIALSNEAQTRMNFVQYLKGLTDAERHSAIDEKIAETRHEILDSEAFGSAIAETNAVGWGVDEYEIQRVDLGEEEYIVTLSYSASGDQDEGKAYSGDRVKGTAKATIDSQGAVDYSEITAKVAHDFEEPDSEEDSGQPE